MKRRPVLTITSLLAISMILSSSGSAFAQDALGGGDALDRNPGVGTGGRNSGRPPNPFAGRNAVVTGEVVGGREFRGRVGYTSPTAFRGPTVSNQLYRFQADSAFSSPAIYKLGNASYDQLRYGQGLSTLEYSRDFAGATPGQIDAMRTPASFAQIAASRFQYDNEALTTSTSSRLETAVQPTMLGTTVNANGDALAIAASSVRGLTLDQYNQRWAERGLTTYDQVRLREELGQTWEQRKADETVSPDAADRVSTQVQTRFEDLQADPRIETSGNDAATVQSGTSADYAKVLQRIADRYAASGDREVKVDPTILKRLDQQFQSLSSELTGTQKGSSAPQQSATPGGNQPLPPQGGQQPSSQAPQSSKTPGRPDLPNPRNPNAPKSDANKPADASKAEGENELSKPADLAALAPALRHGQKIENLTSEQQGRFNELMLAAQEQLKAGSYMQAEQRFQRAVRFAPGNALALAGTANAQIGAGLYLSAGYTIRSLFTQHPEMIDTTYGDGLLPARDRLDAAIAAMQTRLDGQKDRSAYALLLAYLGRQTGDRELMNKGLTVMATESAEDPLPGLLRMVWLEGGEVPKPDTATPEK